MFDPAFGAAIGVPAAVFRFHRGLRNQSAGMDVAKAMFPHPSWITVAGSSAGGVGVVGFTPFLARFLNGNQVRLTVSTTRYSAQRARKRTEAKGLASAAAKTSWASRLPGCSLAARRTTYAWTTGLRDTEPIVP